MANDQVEGASGRPSRRQFFQISAGAISTLILPMSALARLAGGPVTVSDRSVTAPPGVATQRIEGRDKVTGAKIFARDYSARDLKDWPDTQWHAMYLRATTTSQLFIGLDLSILPSGARPTKVIFGDNVNEAIRAPKRAPRRDLEMDLKILAAQSATESDNSFDHPEDLSFDLIVKRGAAPDFLGQAVALLMFKDAAAWRRARKLLQFRDDAVQLYAGEPLPGQGLSDVFSPTSWFVKSDTQGKLFSSATTDSSEYKKRAPKVASDIELALRRDPTLIQQEFSASMQAMDPMFMEPEAGLIWYRQDDKSLNMVLGTQSPDGDIADVKAMYEAHDSPIEVSKLVMTPCFPGGGFGGRDSSPFTYMLALCAAHADGMPVKLAYDRFEQFRVGLKRHAADLAGLVAFTPEKKLQTIKMNMSFDGGGRKNLSPYVAGLAAICAGGSYSVPNADIYAQAVHTENVSGGSQRGFGGPQAFFALETAIDEVAVNQGWDPFSIRRANLAKQGDTTVVGGLIDQSLRLDALLNEAEQHPVWRDRTADKAAFQGDVKYGVGLAMSLQAYGTSGDGVVGAVHISPEGDYEVRTDAVDMGNGSATTLGVVIGRILGANANKVEVADYNLFGQTGLTTTSASGKWPDWDDPNWTAKSVGSSSACLTGLHQVHVVEQAARALCFSSVLPAAATLWRLDRVKLNDVEWRDSALVYRPGGVDPLRIRDIARQIYSADLPTGTVGHGYFQGDWAVGIFDLTDGPVDLALDGLALFFANAPQKPVSQKRQSITPPPADAGSFKRTVWAPCVNLIGASVDTKTGGVQVLKSVSVLNAGRVHVPPLVSGQSQGGVAMMIGYTLLEDMPPGMSGPANGEWNLNRYHVPRLADVPIHGGGSPVDPVQELIVLDPLPEEKFIGRGVAEAVMCSVAPAISNAIRDAVGLRMTDLPITKEKILKGLGS